jgi:hypothetical protein
VGFGDLLLASTTERLYAIFCLVLGAIAGSATVTAVLTSLIEQEDREAGDAAQRIFCTLKFCETHKVSTEVTSRILDFFKASTAETLNLAAG